MSEHKTYFGLIFSSHQGAAELTAIATLARLDSNDLPDGPMLAICDIGDAYMTCIPRHCHDICYKHQSKGSLELQMTSIYGVGWRRSSKPRSAQVGSWCFTRRAFRGVLRLVPRCTHINQHIHNTILLYVGNWSHRTSLSITQAINNAGLRDALRLDMPYPAFLPPALPSHFPNVRFFWCLHTL